MANLKAFLKKMLPIMRMAAMITPNKLDDQAVALLEAWLNSDAEIGAIADVMARK